MHIPQLLLYFLPTKTRYSKCFNTKQNVLKLTSNCAMDYYTCLLYVTAQDVEASSLFGSTVWYNQLLSHHQLHA